MLTSPEKAIVIVRASFSSLLLPFVLYRYTRYQLVGPPPQLPYLSCSCFSGVFLEVRTIDRLVSHTDMSSSFSRALQSLRGHAHSTAPPDMEHGYPGGNPTASAQEPHVDHTGRPQLSADDQLNLFRHLTGITSHPSMTHMHFGGGGRAAPNLGIYSRVVHNEQDAKRSYKRFSWLINCCLGLQIIVAAALTAMGAAGASHSAVTVFGAINTVIAGLLTFLKGSGLPNRMKYYQAEWKRIREFIEQRERDFSRPGCDLDVYAVVDAVESMYDGVKADLEATVPDRFAGIRGGPRAGHPNGEATPATNGLSRIGSEALNEKLKDMESALGTKGKGLLSGLVQQSHLATTAKTAQETAKNLQERTREIADNSTRGLQEQVDRVQHLTDDATTGLKGQVDHAQHLTDDATAGLKDQADRLDQLGETARTIQGDAARNLNEQVERAHHLQEQSTALQHEVTAGLDKQVERASHAETNFLAKLKELRSEIGNRSHLAQEAMHYLQDAYHHSGHEAGKTAGDHRTEPGASS